MNVYRRNSFGSWLADAGWLYALVVLLVSLVFLLPSLSTLTLARGPNGGDDLHSPGAASRGLAGGIQQTYVQETF